jgi:8-hydroxy-5-deazaflavin:NADPH oxidoreductase
MRMGILGSGDVGKALARGFVSRGHDVIIGSREPAKLMDFVREHPPARSGTNEEAARHGEIIVIATAFDGAKSAIDLAGVQSFAGKVVIDVTNPLRFEQGTLSLSIGFDTSAGEQVQRWLPDAKVVKAFNTVGNNLFVDPALPGGPPTMFIAGNDDGAKRAVGDIATAFGWDVFDAGGIEASRYLEPMAMVWIEHAFRTKTRDHAFKILR